MTKTNRAPLVEQIPIDHVTVVNPRARNKKVFEEIVKNIANSASKSPSL